MLTAGVAVAVSLQRPAVEHGLLGSAAASAPASSVSASIPSGPVVCADADEPCRATKTRQWLDLTATVVAERLLPPGDRRVRVATSGDGLFVRDGFWIGGDGGLAAEILPLGYPGTTVRLRIATDAPLLPACRNGSPRSCPQLTVLDGGAVTVANGPRRTEVYSRIGADRFVTVYVSSDPDQPLALPLSERSLIALAEDDRLQLPS